MNSHIRTQSLVVAQSLYCRSLNQMRKVLQSVCLSLLVAGCAQMYAEKRPQLYPNDKLNRTPSNQARADVDRCISLADSYIDDPNKYTEIAKQGLIGGVVGAGTGAVAGTIMGEAGRGTGAGAAVGGILGVLRGLSHMNDSLSIAFISRATRLSGGAPEKK